jgi:chemotaxis protein CheD
VLEAFRSDENPLGARNVETAREQLRTLGIRVVGEDVAGHSGRKLVFDVRTGAAWVRAIEPRPDAVATGGER